MPLKLGPALRIVGLLLLAGLIYALVRTFRRAREGAEPEEVKLFRALEEAAAEEGYARDESMTPTEWAALEGAPEPLKEGVRAYIALRYAGSEERERELERLRGAVRGLRQRE